MIIIPEKQLIVIMPPRTASTSLKNAVRAAYPRAFMPYRHMEASCVPFGYDVFQKVGLFRPAYDRMWSLFCYCQQLEADKAEWSAGRARQMRESTKGGFEQWLLFNRIPFCTSANFDGSVTPYYSVSHVRPENLKSQWWYLRPDLGTTCIPFHDIGRLETLLDIELPHENAASKDRPPLSAVARGHLLQHMSWEGIQ